MHYLSKHSSKLYKILVTNKSISRPTLNEEEFTEFLEMVDAINNLKWDVATIKTKPLSEIKIPSVLSGLFNPGKVALATSEHKLFTELLVKDETEECNLSYGTLDDRLTQICNMKKNYSPDTVSLADIRKVVSISDVGHLLSDEEYAHENVDGKEMPLHLSITLCKDSYLNADIEDAILDTWRNIVKAI